MSVLGAEADDGAAGRVIRARPGGSGGVHQATGQRSGHRPHHRRLRDRGQRDRLRQGDGHPEVPARRDFTYSLQSPVQGGYDGNGLSVLADFLTQKSGYCIHFASAMAVMARLEGIPSRIAVGYAPGRLTGRHGIRRRARVHFPSSRSTPVTPTPGRSCTFRAWAGFRSSPPPHAAWCRPTPRTPSSGGASTNDGNNDGLRAERRRHHRLLHPNPRLSPCREAGKADAGTSWRPCSTALPAVLVLVLVAASPRLVRGSIRARRLRGPASGRNGQAAARSHGQSCWTWPRITACARGQ